MYSFFICLWGCATWNVFCDMKSFHNWVLFDCVSCLSGGCSFLTHAWKHNENLIPSNRFWISRQHIQMFLPKSTTDVLTNFFISGNHASSGNHATSGKYVAPWSSIFLGLIAPLCYNGWYNESISLKSILSDSFDVDRIKNLVYRRWLLGFDSAWLMIKIHLGE